MITALALNSNVRFLDVHDLLTLVVHDLLTFSNVWRFLVDMHWTGYIKSSTSTIHAETFIAEHAYGECPLVFSSFLHICFFNSLDFSTYDNIIYIS